MERRTFLGVLGAGVASLSGCTGKATEDPETESRTPDGSGTQMALDGGVESGLPAPVSIEIGNEDSRRRVLSVEVYRWVSPDCQDETPPCGQPDYREHAVETRLGITEASTVELLGAVEEPGIYHVDVDVVDGGAAEREWEVTAGAAGLEVTVSGGGEPAISTRDR